jgi:hypothetical protein
MLGRIFFGKPVANPDQVPGRLLAENAAAAGSASAARRQVHRDEQAPTS